MISKTKMYGAIGVESAIAIPIILFVIILWAEICFLFYSISSNEHAFTNAVFYAKKEDMNTTSWGSYQVVVESKLRDYGGKLWSSSTVPSSVKINVSYFGDYDSLVQCSTPGLSIDDCSTVSSDYSNSSIAIYSLSYLHKPIVLNWFPIIPIKREIIAVQEYERCKIVGTGRECEH